MIQPDITDAIGLRDRALLETIYSTGLRPLEIITSRVCCLVAGHDGDSVKAGFHDGVCSLLTSTGL